MVRLVIPGGQQLLLCLKAASLVLRIVQLGVGVCHLPAVQEELEPLHIVRIVGLHLRQRGDLNRVIHDKGRLDQMFLNVCLKKQIQKVHAGVFLHRVHHRDALKRL